LEGSKIRGEIEATHTGGGKRKEKEENKGVNPSEFTHSGFGAAEDFGQKSGEAKKQNFHGRENTLGLKCAGHGSGKR